MWLCLWLCQWLCLWLASQKDFLIHPKRSLNQLVFAIVDRAYANETDNLKSKPKWDNILDSKKIIKIKSDKDGFVLIGDVNILSEICKGIFFEVKKEGICMIGVKR